MGFRQDAADLPARVEVGSGLPVRHTRSDHFGGGPERVPLLHRAQGLFSATGHGTPSGFGTGGARYFLPGHARQDGTLRRNRHEGSGREYDRGVRGREHGFQSGPVLYHAEAAGGTGPVPAASFLATLPQRYRRQRDQPPSRQVGGRAGGHTLSAIRSGSDHRWTPE